MKTEATSDSEGAPVFKSNGVLFPEPLPVTKMGPFWGPFDFGGEVSPLRTMLYGHSSCYAENLQGIRQLFSLTTHGSAALLVSM